MKRTPKQVLRLTTLLLPLLGWAAAQAQISIVTSMHPHFDLVRQLVGDTAEVTRILPLGASPHTFDPTPRDVARIAEADLVIFNGGIDEWLLDIVAASGTDAEVVELLEVLDFEPATAEAHEHGEGEAAADADHDEAAHEEANDDEAHGDEHSEEHGEDAHADEAGTEDAHDPGHDHSGVNPHIWTDPVLMARAVPILVDALSEANPENADTYAANGEALVADLQALHAELAQTLAPVGDAPFVPFHDAWPYFVRRYGLNQVAVIEPAPGREPSPSYIADVLEQIEATGATAIFNDVQLPARPAEVVAEAAGVALYTLDPEGGGTSDDETYGEFMRANAATIAEALAR